MVTSRDDSFIYSNDNLDYRSSKRVENAPKIKRLTDPSTIPLPVSLQEFKDWARIKTTSEDSLITEILETARDVIEDYATITYLLQDYEVTYDLQRIEYNNRIGIELPFVPFDSVIEVRTVDFDGNETVVPTTDYVITNDSDLTRAAFRFLDGFSYDSMRSYNSLKIKYKAGYIDSSSIRFKPWKTALKKLATTYFYNREVMNEEIPENVIAMMQRYIPETI